MLPRSAAPVPSLQVSPASVSLSAQRRTRVLFCVLLVAGTFAVYSQAGSLGFIRIDDPEYAAQNPQVQAGLSLAGLQWSLRIHDCNWIPLTWLSLMLDSTIFGIRPAGYHVSNVILHSANAMLLFLALASATGYTARSAFVAALFALHPLHVESVAWIAERKDVLSIFFGLWSMWIYVRYAQVGQTWRLVASFLLFLCSLLAKPTLVTLPFVLLLLDFWPLGRLKAAAQEPAVTAGRPPPQSHVSGKPAAPTVRISPKTLLRPLLEKIPYFAATAAFSSIAFFAQSTGGAVAAYPFSVRWRNAVCVYWAYLEKTAYPVDLAFYYPHPGSDIPWTSWGVALLFLLVVTASTVALLRRYPFLFVGWFWYLGTLVPMIGFVQIGGQQMADRYTYFPLIGIFLAVVWLLSELAPAARLGPRLLPLAGLAWLGLLAYFTVSLVSFWHDSVTLFRHAQSCTPDNSAIRVYLGAALLDENSPEEALPELQAAIRVGAPDATAHSDLGYAYELLGRKEEALAEYATAVALDPQLVEPENGIARIKSERGDFSEARRHWERAKQLDADNPLAYLNLAASCVKTGDFSQALANAEHGLELNPRLYPCEIVSAQALRGMGRYDDAIRRLEALSRIAPDDPAVKQELAETFAQQRGSSPK